MICSAEALFCVSVKLLSLSSLGFGFAFFSLCLFTESEKLAIVGFVRACTGLDGDNAALEAIRKAVALNSKAKYKR